MLAIALALFSSLVYGVSDFLGGLKARSLPLLWVLLISQGSALVALAVLVAALGEAPPSGSYLLYAVLAGIAEAVGVAALYRGLAVGAMSIVAAIAAIAPTVPVVAAFFLGEAPTPLQGAGIVFALAGVAIIASGARFVRGERPISPPVRASILFGVLTAFGFGGFLLGMDAASEGSIPWALFLARLTTVATFAAVYLSTRPPVAIRGSELPVLATIGLLVLGADSLYALAATEGLLSVVAVLSSLYPAVTIALARIYLKERLQVSQKIGVATVLAGAVAIASA